MDADGRPRLVGRLGLLDATAVALGAMIGAGVFVAMGEASATTGASLPLAILLAAPVATATALSATQLGVVYRQAGGAYEFGYQLLAPVAGFLAGWIFLLAGLAASTTYVLTFAHYLEPLLPGVSPRVLGVPLALAAVATNAWGVRLSSRANELLVVFKIAVLIAFVILGAGLFDPRNLAPLFVADVGGLLAAAALMFFAFAGFARPVTIVEELRNPRSDLPRAVLISLLSTTLLYLAVAIVAMGAIGPLAFGESRAPLRAALERSGTLGPALMSAGALVATVNVLLLEIWGLSRLAFAMARRGDLPPFLAQVGTNGLPRRAVLAVGGLVVLLSAFANLRPALEASSLALLTYYGILNLAALRLEAARLLYPRLLPAVGLGSCVALALSLSLTAFLINLGVIALGLIYFLLLRSRLSYRQSIDN